MSLFSEETTIRNCNVLQMSPSLWKLQVVSLWMASCKSGVVNYKLGVKSQSLTRTFCQLANSLTRKILTRNSHLADSQLAPRKLAPRNSHNSHTHSFVMVYTALDLSPVWICQEQSSSHGQHMGGRLVQLGSFLNLYFNSSLFTRFSVGLVCCSCPLNLFKKGFPSKMFSEEGNCLVDDY